MVYIGYCVLHHTARRYEFMGEIISGGINYIEIESLSSTVFVHWRKINTSQNRRARFELRFGATKL